MKKLLIGFLLLIVLVIGVALVAPTFIPVETYKEQITAQAKAATGRELTVAGDISLSILPRLALEMEGVAFQNAPGASAPNMLELARLSVELDIWPILSGEIVVNRFVLVEPVIRLEIAADGTPNWQFAGAEAGESMTESSADASGGGAPAGLSDIKLGEVGLEGGVLSYSDARTGVSHEITGINMALSLPSLDQPLAAKGGLTWNGEAIEIDATIARPRVLLDGGSTALEAKIAANPVNLGFKGEVTLGDLLAVGGAVSLDVPSVRGLAAWAGQPIDMPGDGLGPLTIDGELDLKGSRIAFENARLKIDAIEGSGRVAIDTGGARPMIEATLDTGVLDLNPYLPPRAEGDAAPGGATSGGAAAPAEAQPWSQETIDFSGLKAVDADLSFSTEGILVQDLKVGKSALTVKLAGGRLDVALTELALYGGGGTGSITLDASGATPRIAKNFKLSGLQAEPFLTDAAGFDRLSGTVDFNIAVTGAGASEMAIVQSLKGKGQAKFLDGAIKGINLAAMVRNVTTAFSGGEAEEPKTDFAELSGSFTIAKGILTNQDLALKSPLIRVAGSGTVEIPPKTVNYRIEPKLVASLEGQGGAGDAAGIMVPVLVTGPWHDLSYAPDLAGMLSGGVEGAQKLIEGAAGSVGGAVEGVVGGVTEGATGAVEGVVEGVTGGAGSVVEGVTGAIGGILGGGSSEPAPPAAEEPAPAEAAPAEESANPLNTLKNLLGN